MLSRSRWQFLINRINVGRGFHYSYTAIETALMLTGLFKLPQRALEGFINSLFQQNGGAFAITRL